MVGGATWRWRLGWLNIVPSRLVSEPRDGDMDATWEHMASATRGACAVRASQQVSSGFGLSFGGLVTVGGAIFEFRECSTAQLVAGRNKELVREPRESSVVLRRGLTSPVGQRLCVSKPQAGS